MNVFDRISGSPAPTKVAYGFCAGIILISVAVIGVNALTLSKKMAETSDLTSQLTNLQAEHNNMSMELQTGSSAGKNVVEAELYNPATNGDKISLFENTMANGQTLSNAEMVTVTAIMSQKTYKWLDTSDVTYTFISNIGFTESEFTTVWAAVDSNRNVLAYITAKYDSTTDTFDDFVVYRTVNYQPDGIQTEETTETYVQYANSEGSMPVEPTVPVFGDETTETTEFLDENVVYTDEGMISETHIDSIETSEVVEDA